MLERLVFLLLLGTVFGVDAAPNAELWPKWQAHDAEATATIDHAAYDAFLDTYVVARDNAPNRVRYDAVTPGAHDRIERYIDDMTQIDIADYNRDVQRAYWINLYNAITLDVVLDHDPVDSIRDIGGGLFFSGPWRKKRVTIGGSRLSLDDIEHRILRPIWADGLTHYGVNCASMGCPSLRPTAYTGENVYAALRDNAADYVNSAAGIRIEDDRVVLSKIYDWYAQDFGGSLPGVISHLRRYAGPDLSARLDTVSAVDDYGYDWSLNAAVSDDPD